MRDDHLRLDRAISVASTGAGVFSRAEALLAGASAADVATALRSGRWRALARGVYVLGDSDVDPWCLTVAAAQRRRASGTVARGRTAAQLHGLPLLGARPQRAELRRSRGAGGERALADVGAGWQPDAHVTLLQGVRVTTVARTAVDLARRGNLFQGVAALDAALWRGCSRAELEQVLADGPRCPGNAAARTALEAARRGAESPLESIGRLRLVDAGLPEPLLQAEVRDERGLVGRVDHLWREQGVVGEADGLGKYDAWEAVTAEKLREDRLRELGLEVFRYTWEDAWSRPERLEQKARRAFARAGAPRRSA